MKRGTFRAPDGKYYPEKYRFAACLMPRIIRHHTDLPPSSERIKATPQFSNSADSAEIAEGEAGDGAK